MQERKTKEKKEPYLPLRLPPPLTWEQLSFEQTEAEKLIPFLNEHFYWDNTFRARVSTAFVDWAFCKPNYLRDWQFGLSVGGQLMAVVVAVPLQVIVAGREVKSAKVVCFACSEGISKKMPRIIDRLINELKRRVAYRKRANTLYKYPTPISEFISILQTHMRKINYKKINDLYNIKMNPLLHRVYELPDEFSTPALKPMSKGDVGPVFQFLKTQARLTGILLSEDEIKATFLPRQDFLYTYVASRGKKEVYSMFSFYQMVIAVNDKQTLVVGKVIALLGEELKELARDMLVAAKKHGIDALYADDSQLSPAQLEELHFELQGKQFLFADEVADWKVEPRRVGLLL